MARARCYHIFVPLREVTIDWDELRQALCSLPGVKDVALTPREPAPHAAPSIEGEVLVSYDPDLTDPIVWEQELARRNLTILSAEEVLPRDS
ncbi:MAG: hypothetical protein HY331_12455 [Chloroflexi bacterium]|nr:hypothetical protein [Chloroflexota bacterium]